jgi:hypothetical protein
VRHKSVPDNKEYKRVLPYFETFSSESGKAVLKDMRKMYFDRQSYVPGDQYATAFLEGQRSVVADILSFLSQSKHPEIFEESPDDYNE